MRRGGAKLGAAALQEVLGVLAPPRLEPWLLGPIRIQRSRPVAEEVSNPLASRGHRGHDALIQFADGAAIQSLDELLGVVADAALMLTVMAEPDSVASPRARLHQFPPGFAGGWLSSYSRMRS